MLILRARAHLKLLAGAASLVALLAACGHNEPDDIILKPTNDNAVAYWHDVGAATINASAAVTTTPEEQRPSFATDLATMHLAIYDAVSAIDGHYKPFLPGTPISPSAGASMDAAVSAASYGVLRALFPNRGAQYQAAYDSYVAAIPAGEAKTRGLALGAEVAAAIVANRSNDGRAVALAPYMPGTAPGKFRGVNPINRFFPYIRPFTMTSASQFRPPAPPAIDSVAYATDLNEVKALGGAVSATRTPAQLETARFQSEAPATFFTRNFGKFARTTADVADAARLMAIIYVGYADAIEACVEAKYFYEAWRPLSAIPLADTDNNPATVAEPGWTPSVPTPNHPEYPAAHSCTAGALGELLRQYYGTEQVSFSFDSTVTGTTRTYTRTGALAEESKVARIYGGMHFRYSTTAGAELGKQVANWTLQHQFGKRN
jgi:hypothetical protein